MTAVQLIAAQMDEAYQMLQKNLRGLTEAEFFWKPSESAWTIRKFGNRWEVDYDYPTPIPKGPLTIAWLLAHIAHCKVMYYEYTFGKAKKQWDELITPGAVSDMLDYLEDAHRPWRNLLNTLAEADLDQPRLTNWGEKKPTWWHLWIMIYHDSYHGAQIQTTRKIFRALQGLPIC